MFMAPRARRVSKAASSACSGVVKTANRLSASCLMTSPPLPSMAGRAACSIWWIIARKWMMPWLWVMREKPHMSSTRMATLRTNACSIAASITPVPLAGIWLRSDSRRRR